MVMQYRKKGSSGKWTDYEGKEAFEKSGKKFSDYEFRLLNSDKTKVLVVAGGYDSVLKRMRQIEFFKHR